MIFSVNLILVTYIITPFSVTAAWCVTAPCVATGWPLVPKNMYMIQLHGFEPEYSWGFVHSCLIFCSSIEAPLKYTREAKVKMHFCTECTEIWQIWCESLFSSITCFARRNRWIYRGRNGNVLQRQYLVTYTEEIAKSTVIIGHMTRAFVLKNPVCFREMSPISSKLVCREFRALK